MRKITPISAAFSISLLAACSTLSDNEALNADYPGHTTTAYQWTAEKNTGAALLKLALFIDRGDLHPEHYGHAGKWFIKACKRGSLAGCNNTGLAFEQGENGLGRDFEQSRAHYLKAAQQGYLPSQYNLGGLYAEGHITPADDVEGYKWILIAEKTADKCKNSPICQWVLNDRLWHKFRLKERLTAQQQQKAHRLASLWTPKAANPAVAPRQNLISQLKSADQAEEKSNSKPCSTC